jgi:hypothetical protein
MASLVNSPLGTVNYNGYTFSGAASSRVQCRTPTDRAGRTTVYVEYAFMIRDIIVPDGMNIAGQIGTDHAMNNIRNQLTVRGQRLQFSLQGFGDFDVNGPGGVLDVAYGPHPEVMEMTPLGGGQAWSMLWRCTTRFPQCGGAVYQGRPLASNYDVEIKQDKHGYSVRTITGYYEVPGNRQGSNISDTADGYWESILGGIPRIPGFEREWTRKMSLDKRTMEYSIVDTEKGPTGFMFGCTEWEGEQESVIQHGGPVAMVTLTASYEVEKNQTKHIAMNNFYALIVSRVMAGAPFGSLTKLFPLNFVVRDQLHGRRVTGSLSYQVGSDPRTILATTGLFAPIPNSDFVVWPSTVGPAIGPRGEANLVYDQSSDVIIDLCTATQTGVRTGGGPPPDKEERENHEFTATLPPPNQSYLQYMMSLRTMCNTNLYFSKPMSVDLKTSDYQQNQLQSGDPFNVPPAGNRLENQIENNPGTVPDLVQATVAADWYILLSGGALRMGYPVPFPNVQTFGNIPAYLVDSDCQTGIGMNAGIPLHWATFNLLYRCPSKPVSSAALYNPVLQTTDPT